MSERPTEATTARLLDGREIARKVRSKLRQRISSFEGTHGFTPRLAILLVGDRPDSVLYARNLERWCTRLGLGVELRRLDREAGTGEVVDAVARLSHDSHVHGIIVQLPLPEQVDARAVFAALDPLRDVEGQHPENVGLLAMGAPRFVPTTPLAGVELLDAYDVELSGRHVAILGRSGVVGRPLAHLMLARDATVTILHSRSRDAGSILRRADVIAAAAGRPRLVTKDDVRPGAVILDFGINFVDGELVGDVAFDEVAEVASMISPVPGGVGPLTNLMLARNLMDAAEMQAGQENLDRGPT